MLETLTAENFETLVNFKHGFFTRKGGVSAGVFASLNCGLSTKNDRSEVLENRRRVAEHLGVAAENLLSAHQVHSPDVATVTALWTPDKRPEVDALVTKEKGIALAVLTADCAPVLFADPRHGVIGTAHAGWRGALTGVIENTVAAMEKLGATRTSIQAAIGPCIWQKSYEVGPEFPAPFLAEDDAHKRFFRPAFRSDHYMFDLPGYVASKLKALGLASVAVSPADTLSEEERFFSYRRHCLKGDPRTGIQISVLVQM